MVAPRITYIRRKPEEPRWGHALQSPPWHILNEATGAPRCVGHRAVGLRLGDLRVETSEELHPDSRLCEVCPCIRWQFTPEKKQAWHDYRLRTAPRAVLRRPRGNPW